MWVFLLLPVFCLHSRGTPLVTITIDAPVNATSPEVIHVTPLGATEVVTVGDQTPTSPTVTVTASEISDSATEQVIRIEVVNSEDWWSTEASQLHFPRELSVRLLLGFLGLSFLCGLGVSLFMILRWWHLNHSTKANLTPTPPTPTPPPGILIQQDFHQIVV